MRDLTAFNRRLALTFGAGYVAGYDDAAGRWYVETPTADGKTVRQFWCWFSDPNRLDPDTGRPMPLAADPVTGLHPYRDLDEGAQEEIVRNLHRSYIGKTGYAAIDWRRAMQAARDHNTALAAQKRRAAAQTFADLIASVDIRRPGWLKEYGPQKVRTA